MNLDELYGIENPVIVFSGDTEDTKYMRVFQDDDHVVILDLSTGEVIESTPIQ
jgi:hypothetical protein